MHYREKFNDEISIVMRINPYSCSHCALTVYVVFNKMEVGRPRRIGHAYVDIKGGVAELEDNKVEIPYRHKGISSSMLKLVIDYLKDANITEFFGHINDADNLEKAESLYKKNGFEITEYFEVIEQKDINMALSKTSHPEFFSRHKLQPITEEEYEKSI